MKKTKAYHFRGYTIHVPEELFVYIGNKETELLIYKDDRNYALMASVRWLSHRESLQVTVSWHLWFEHCLDDEQQIYVDFDPDYQR